MKGRCRNHAVCRIQGHPSQLALTIQCAPPVSDSMGDGQNAVMKPCQQVGVEPSLKLGAAATQRKHDKSLADFTNRDSAQEQLRYRLCFEPLRDTRFWANSAEF